MLEYLECLFCIIFLFGGDLLWEEILLMLCVFFRRCFIDCFILEFDIVWGLLLLGVFLDFDLGFCVLVFGGLREKYKDFFFLGNWIEMVLLGML